MYKIFKYIKKIYKNKLKKGIFKKTITKKVNNKVNKKNLNNIKKNEINKKQNNKQNNKKNEINEKPNNKNNEINKKPNKYVKKQIPKALREQVWIKYNGKRFNKKCYVKWCKNDINCFNFDCGHDIPESKGGATVIENLKPICRNCNLSMGNNLSIKEWNIKYQDNKSSCIIQ